MSWGWLGLPPHLPQILLRGDHSRVPLLNTQPHSALLPPGPRHTSPQETEGKGDSAPLSLCCKLQSHQVTQQVSVWSLHQEKV